MCAVIGTLAMPPSYPLYHAPVRQSMAPQLNPGPYLVVWRADQGIWETLLRIREKGGLAFPAVHLTLS